MSDTLLFVGTHADHLASGQPIAPGDRIPAEALNPDDPNDQRLRAELLRSIDEETVFDPATASDEDLDAFVGEHTVDAVVDAAAADRDWAGRLLDAERRGQKRSTLIDRLEQITTSEEAS